MLSTKTPADHSSTAEMRDPLEYAAKTFVNHALGTARVSIDILKMSMQALIVASLESNQNFIIVCSRYVDNLTAKDKIKIAKFMNEKKLFAFVANLTPPIKNNSVCFTGTLINIMPMEILCHILSMDFGITHLDLSNAKISPKAYTMLSESLVLINKLEFLDFSNNNVDDICLLLNSLCSLSTLKGLNLSGVKLNDEAVNCIAAMLKSPKSQLEVLDLSNTKISDQGFRILADALKTNTKLKGLDFSNNSIGKNDWLVLIIRKIIMNARGLTMLGLNNCSLQQKHVQWIALDLPRNNLSMHDIDLDDNDISIVSAPVAHLCTNAYPVGNRLAKPSFPPTSHVKTKALS